MSPRWSSVFLSLAFASGTIAVIAALLVQPPGVPLATRLFEAAGILTFSEVVGAEPSRALAVAYVATVVFGGAVVLGAALELFPSFRDAVRRAWIVARTVAGQPPAVVVGVGWVGAPLARALARKGRPVYASALDTESARAEAARRDGVLVVAGDASDDAVRARLGLRHARDVVIATGDDARNVEIAGDLLRDADDGRLGATAGHVHAFVHVDDPSLRAAIRRAGLLRTAETSALTVEMFGASELAARQLVYDPEIGLAQTHGLSPADDEVPHLLVFGLGPLGRTVVLEAARSLHFAGGHRPRVTVFGRDRAAWRAFLERHPGLAPDALDLTSDAFFAHADPDAWATRAGRPCDPHHRVDAWAHVEGDAVVEAGGRRVRPVEYAANAEFVEVVGDVAGVDVVAAVRARVDPTQGRPVRAAAVICLEDERQALEAALRLRRALHDRLDAPTDLAAPVLPVYVHLPTEAGLTVVIDGAATEEAGLTSRFPLHPFGKQSAVMSVEAVAGPEARVRAGWIGASHAQVRGAPVHPHTDFEDSNMAADRFLPVRFDAVRATYPCALHTPAAAAAGGRCPPPLLEPLMASDVLCHPRYAALEAAAGPEGIPVTALPEDLPEAVAGWPPPTAPPSPDDVLPRLYERLALLGRIAVPAAPGPLPAAPTPAARERHRAAAARHARWRGLVDALTERALARFEAEIRAAGRDPGAMARMEHNRWMGERLVKGWRFGTKSDATQTRTTFVPGSDLEDGQWRYDRVQPARALLEHGPAFEPPGADTPWRPPQVAYLRADAGRRV